MRTTATCLWFQFNLPRWRKFNDVLELTCEDWCGTTGRTSSSSTQFDETHGLRRLNTLPEPRDACAKSKACDRTETHAGKPFGLQNEIVQSDHWISSWKHAWHGAQCSRCIRNVQSSLILRAQCGTEISRERRLVGASRNAESKPRANDACRQKLRPSGLHHMVCTTMHIRSYYIRLLFTHAKGGMCSSG